MTIHVGDGHPGALKLVAAALAAAVRPQPPVPFREWLSKNIVLVDGEHKGELWSADNAPYLPEIADCLSLDHPATLVTVRKSVQTGISILALAWCLYIADTAPDNILYGLPTLDLLQGINGQKLTPLIDAWQQHTGKKIIFPAVDRSGRGSTIYDKRFAGGTLSLVNANSVTDLSATTMRYGVKDEVSKWKTYKNGENPEELFFDRFTAFRRTGSFKIFELSTPEIDTGDALGEAPGHCRIDRSFKRSDQRFWNIQCPECGFWQKQFYENFICDRNHPQRSRYLCQACGHEISETERVIGVRSGHFVATAEGPDRHPGFHVDAFDSLMMSYEAIAQNIITYLLPGGWGDRGIYNRVLGLPAVEKGNAPEYERLMERREDYAEGVVPAEGLIVVAAADVQHYGIWAEAVAFSEDRQSWSLTAQFFDGPTDDINAGAWVKVDAFYRKPLVDVFGQERRIEALAVDGGDHGRMNQALEWCRRRPGARAIKGLPGRYVPAVGLPSRKSVTTRGKRRRFGYSDLWPVGTWSLKSEFMADLHKTGLAAGAPADPPGYCHFGNFLTKEYFLQITAESFVTEFVAGKFKEEWKPIRRDNHLLDCRIYAMAMAELLGLTRMTTDDWARLRATIQPAGQTDLLSPSAQRAVAQRKPEAREAESAPSADAGSIAEKRKAWGNRG